MVIVEFATKYMIAYVLLSLHRFRCIVLVLVAFVGQLSMVISAFIAFVPSGFDSLCR